VVIAKATTTKDTGKTLRLQPGNEADFMAVVTQFDVRLALKGKSDRARIDVLHYREWNEEWERRPLQWQLQHLRNGPILATFRTAAAATGAQSTPEYFLFLRKQPDGRYAPTSGQGDSAFSVRCLVTWRQEQQLEKETKEPQPGVGELDPRRVSHLQRQRFGKKEYGLFSLPCG